MKRKINFWAYPLALIAASLFVIAGCSDDKDEVLPDENTPGKVYDIDDNKYKTIKIGDQIWMAENLRVTRYNNGSDIPTGLTDSQWKNATGGAYAIYPHSGGYFEEDVVGIESDQEMTEAYGNLYNWHVVGNPGGICPKGWTVPGNDDWMQLMDYIMDTTDRTNHHEDPSGVGNSLKSCLQVNSPANEDCNTSIHPRWNAHHTHHGFDEFGFSALPGGYRGNNGQYYNIGVYAYWWSSTMYSSASSYWWFLSDYFGSLNRYETDRKFGFAIRCIRVTEE